jgi:hypothetical protein
VLDPCAELTLQVLRFVQQPLENPSFPRRWTLIPEGQRLGWVAAREWLASQPKPIMVAALAEPGLIGTWSATGVPDKGAENTAQSFASQQQWLEGAVAKYGWTDSDRVLFETVGDSLELSLTDLRRWLREYAFFAPWTVGEGPDRERPARLLVRRPDGSWSPGMTCEVGQGR